MSSFCRGSEWRKWDLHVHTPYTYLNKYKATDDEFVKKIIEEKLAVVGLTNYFKFDKKEYELKNILEGKGICVFLNLELRLTYQNKEDQCCDIHIVFDNELPESIINDFLSNLTLKVDANAVKAKDLSIENDGFAKAVVEFNDLIRVLEDESLRLNNKYLIGFLSRGKGNSRSSNAYEIIARESNILIHSSDNELNIQKDREFWLEHNKPLLQCSDTHAIEDIGSKYTWIKADPTFEGLKQIIFEPRDRIHIDDEKPEKHGYRAIDKVILRKDEENFWDQTICFNENLNTIIGGRATGKSTLLSSIANRFGEMINPEEYIKKHSENLTVIWKDGDENDSREVEFFPQNYMYDLARNDTERNSLINEIIEEYDTESLLSNYVKFVESNKSNISKEISNSFNIKTEIDGINEKIKAIGDKTGISKGIEETKAKIEASKVTLSEEVKKEYERVSNLINNNGRKIISISDDIRKIENIKVSELYNTSLKYDFTSLSEKSKNKIEKVYTKLVSEFKQKWESEIANIVIQLNEDKQRFIQDNVSLMKNTDYKSGLEFLEKNKYLKGLDKIISDETKKLNEINIEEKKREEKKKILEEIIDKITSNVKEYKSKIDELKQNFRIDQKDIQIGVEFNLDDIGMTSLLSKSLNLRGNERQDFVSQFAQSYKENIVNCTKDFLIKALDNKVEYKGEYLKKNLSNFPVELISVNWFDKSFQLTYQGDVFENMSQGKQAFVILKLLLEFSKKECPILIDQPEDSLDNRAIYNELVKYLVNKKKERQIILVTHNSNVVVSSDAEQVIVANQHGEKTRNKRGVKFQYLTGSLENTKVKTVVSNTEEDKQIVLEKQGVREHVCEILEGGNEAFKKREMKYGI